MTPAVDSVTRGPARKAASHWTIAIALNLALLTQGCTGGHDRPEGHADISFGISPSGDSLVFNATGEGGRDLFLLDLKTHRVSRIAATPDYELDPEFSPDGKSVVYAAGSPGDRADHVYLRSLDGKLVTQLTRGDANDASPTFSPDGSLVVFTRDKTYNWGGSASHWDAGGVICTIKADGTGLRQITTDGSLAIDPHFSPDGRKILFWNETGWSTVNAAGPATPSPLNAVPGRDPSYSPSGQFVAFSSGRYAPDHRIFVAKTDGTDRRRLAGPGGEVREFPGGGCFRPVFMPDGRRIVFFVESWPSGPTGVAKENLWEIELEENSPWEIADYSLFDDAVHWRPKSQSTARTH